MAFRVKEPVPVGRYQRVVVPDSQCWLAVPVRAVGAVTVTDGAVVSTFASAEAVDGDDVLPTLSVMVMR